MLSPERAEPALKEFQQPDWAETVLVPLERLSPRCRATARAMLRQILPGPARAELAYVDEDEQVEGFRHMPDSERAPFLTALFGDLAPVVEHGWQLHERLPYQTLWEGRKPFRAPGRNDLLASARLGWVYSLLRTIGPYRQNPTWIAAWAPHLADYKDAEGLGILLAAAIDAGGKQGDEIFEILCASARGDHEIGGMGRHVTRGLLCASRPDGWALIEKLLLAAQRQEGLRQTILESVDEAHPEAFRRMLHLILDHDLVRFSSTVRAFNVWLGYFWEAANAGLVKRTISQMLTYLENEGARATALAGNDAEQAYLALWSTAFDSGPEAIPAATHLLGHPDAGHRYAATHLLRQLMIDDIEVPLLAALDDADLRISLHALGYFDSRPRAAQAIAQGVDAFDAIVRQINRYPAKRTVLPAIVWPWTVVAVSCDVATKALVHNRGSRRPSCLIPHLATMDVWTRCFAATLLVQQKKWDAATMDAALDLVTDGSQHVRNATLKGFEQRTILAADAGKIEKRLTSGVGDLRRGVIGLLRGLADPDALASADRLLASKHAQQRLAGTELLRGLAEDGRAVAQCRLRAEQYRTVRQTPSDAEQQHLDVILGAETAAPTLADALGLAPESRRTWPATPLRRAVEFRTAAPRRIIVALHAMLQDRAREPVTIREWDGALHEGTLGEVRLPWPDHRLGIDQDRERLPLAATWERWWLERREDLRDQDGMELARALVQCEAAGDGHQRRYLRSLFPDELAVLAGDADPIPQGTAWNIAAVLKWMARLFPPAGVADFALDAAETGLAMVKPEWTEYTDADRELRDSYFRTGLNPPASLQWQWQSPLTMWLKVAADFHQHAPLPWTDQQLTRLWHLWRWLDEPRREATNRLPRSSPPLAVVTAAHLVGAATDEDVFDLLAGERFEQGNRHYFLELKQLSRRQAPELARFPALAPLVERVRQRILEIELQRGDTATAASVAALVLRTVWGSETAVALLRALGSRTFRRGFAYDNESLETVYSHLVRSCLPRESDTADRFATLAREAGIPAQRLVETAVYAPQWAGFVEHALRWSGLAEGVWWVHAHTRNSESFVDKEIAEIWRADLSTRTELAADDLLDGGVDVAWFHRVHAALGARWDVLYDAAKYASSSAGHTRARLFADAMLGETTKRDLVGLITAKRHQDAVRALGLLPLAKGTKRDIEVLERYQIIQDFIRGSRKFGSMRQASEKRAAQIGLDNLARTAGYADPIRLQWAMEARAIADLADGPITAKAGNVVVSLAVNAWGDVELTATKDGKLLADIPAKVKTVPAIKALRERKTAVKRQASRIRPSLEQLMVRGDGFTGAELQNLVKHPLLAPMLSGLVLVGDGIIGYPAQGGKALTDHGGALHPLGKKESVRIAHPLDLLPAKSWHQWQRDCFAHERIQPFKQVFRELYTLTDTERAERTQTRRYAGYQVQPRQALALLGGRGWVTHPEEGTRRTFHAEGIVAWLGFMEPFYTPAEIEGLTLEGVRFSRRGSLEPLELKDVPSRLFSEAMRDLDLVVSVAHQGGVDPEASASSTTMRAALVEQTAALLGLENVKVQNQHVYIDGEMARYSVHLGSAVTHRLPGGMLLIVPVHGQHRGRLFLPFADDDPRSAEVLSKVLLLARDLEIKDPNILDQIRAS